MSDTPTFFLKQDGYSTILAITLILNRSRNGIFHYAASQYSNKLRYLGYCNDFCSVSAGAYSCSLYIRHLISLFTESTGPSLRRVASTPYRECHTGFFTPLFSLFVY